MDSLASEMAAFANSDGGTILIGVNDDGSIPKKSLGDFFRYPGSSTQTGYPQKLEWIVPQFVIKAIQYPGNKIHPSDYLDTEDFAGPLPRVFENALAFIMRNLHKIQAGRGINMPGKPEIPEAVFEELLVNALVHRDYLVSAPIRLFIFDNRIEIISPGHQKSPWVIGRTLISKITGMPAYLLQQSIEKKNNRI